MQKPVLMILLSLCLMLFGIIFTGCRPNKGSVFDPVPDGPQIFVAPNGQPNNPGTIDSPTTLEVAITRVVPGGVIYMRGGTYYYSSTITIEKSNKGTPGKRKNIYAYQNEEPILNFKAQTEDDKNRGLQLFDDYWHVRGLTVEWAGDNGIFIGGNHNIIERCITRYNRDSGLQIARASKSDTVIDQWPSYNLILNCDSYGNADSDGEDADGFACKLTSGKGNVFRGCIAYCNSDDGWDLYTKKEHGAIGPVVIEDCIAFSNGFLPDRSKPAKGDGNGYKLGSDSHAVPHIVRRCIAFHNRKHGFTYNKNLGPIEISNCTSWHNSMETPDTQNKQDYNFNFSGGDHIMYNNLSWEGGGSDVGHVPSGETVHHNVFYKKDKGTYENDMGVTLTVEDFLVKPTYQFGVSPFTRNEDGSINYGSFLQLAPNSDLRGAGFKGYDIGARGNVGNEIYSP